jgi:hypothetical protein
VVHNCTTLIIELSAEKFARKLLGEGEIEAALQRLDRLTVDEARMTGTQTLQVVHGLLSNMKLVMDGTQPLLCLLSTAHSIVFRIDGKASTDGLQQALGMFNM